MHLKREQTKKYWPIPRKGTKYLAVASHEKDNALPLVVVMRNFLGLVKNRKELQKLLNEKRVIINSKEIRNTSYPITLFDVLSLPLLNKHYKAVLRNKKMIVEEISEKEANKVIYKVINKKLLPKGKIQINLNNGKNILVESKEIETGNFIVLDSKDNKVIKIMKLEKGSKVLVIKGKHIGVYGQIKDVKEEGNHMIAEVTPEDKKEIIKVNLNNLFATN